mmetsp:Transcript_17018/g.57262  ORF Transcript_17018/g.57262 Transcript_17018/m.57262 type:complete len:266 (-) Transcript_17018:260-1057(-)
MRDPPAASCRLCGRLLPGSIRQVQDRDGRAERRVQKVPRRLCSALQLGGDARAARRISVPGADLCPRCRPAVRLRPRHSRLERCRGPEVRLLRRPLPRRPAVPRGSHDGASPVHRGELLPGGDERASAVPRGLVLGRNEPDEGGRVHAVPSRLHLPGGQHRPRPLQRRHDDVPPRVHGVRRVRRGLLPRPRGGPGLHQGVQVVPGPAFLSAGRRRALHLRSRHTHRLAQRLERLVARLERVVAAVCVQGEGRRVEPVPRRRRLVG